MAFFGPRDTLGGPESPDAFYHVLRACMKPHLPCTKMAVYFTLGQALTFEVYSNTSNTFASGIAARREDLQWVDCASGAPLSAPAHDGATLYTQRSFGAVTAVASYMANAMSLLFAPLRPVEPMAVTFSWATKVYAFTVLPWDGMRLVDNLKANTGSYFGDLVCISRGPFDFTWHSRLECGLDYVGKSCIVTDFELAKALVGPSYAVKHSVAMSMLQFTPPRKKAKTDVSAVSAEAPQSATQSAVAEMDAALGQWIVIA